MKAQFRAVFTVITSITRSMSNMLIVMIGHSKKKNVLKSICESQK